MRRVMRKPVQRPILLEDVLRDFLEVEDILLKLELKGVLQPLTVEQRQLYKQAITKMRKLVRDLAKHVAKEHKAA
jgi:SNF2 family DNA or RNA helicase